MNERNEKLIMAFGQIDEKYIKESEEKMNVMRIAKIAVSFAIIIALERRQLQ